MKRSPENTQLNIIFTVLLIILLVVFFIIGVVFLPQSERINNIGAPRGEEVVPAE